MDVDRWWLVASRLGWLAVGFLISLATRFPC